MQVTLNGQPLALEAPLTVAQLLERLDLARGPCAVEVNRRVVPHREHATHPVEDGDAVEVVTLVGGG